MKIRIGIGLGTQSFPSDGQFLELCQEMERIGFDSIWLSERLTGPTYDPIVSLSYVAGGTRKLKLGTSVLVLPGRNPAILAKELATLDRLSNGRLIPAMGLGAVDPMEHQAFGVQRTERGSIFNESLPLLRRFWTEDHVTHHGQHFHYDDVTIQPKPIQSTPDIWLGGMAASELRRTGRIGDGWLPSTCTPAEAAAGRATIEEAAAEAGRAIEPEHYGASITYVENEIPDYLAKRVTRRRPDTDPRELIPVGLSETRALMERFIDVGFSKFVVRPAREPEHWTPELERIAESLLTLEN
ncbi:MAG: TIGR03619 family F420-dependent LLM class oxidoreductase [Chloroflexota bacterium]